MYVTIGRISVQYNFIFVCFQLTYNLQCLCSNVCFINKVSSMSFTFFFVFYYLWCCYCLMFPKDLYIPLFSKILSSIYRFSLLFYKEQMLLESCCFNLNNKSYIFCLFYKFWKMFTKFLISCNHNNVDAYTSKSDLLTAWCKARLQTTANVSPSLTFQWLYSLYLQPLLLFKI